MKNWNESIHEVRWKIIWIIFCFQSEVKMLRTSAKSWKDSLWHRNLSRKKQWGALKYLITCPHRYLDTPLMFLYLSVDLPASLSASRLSSSPSFPSFGRCFASFRGQPRVGRGSPGVQRPHGQRGAPASRTPPAGLWPEEGAAGRGRPAR